MKLNKSPAGTQAHLLIFGTQGASLKGDKEADNA
jgi:hypothetical protein